MRITLPEEYMPSPGVTITATFLHNMVDQATLDQLEESEVIAGGSIFASSPASGSYGYMVFAANGETGEQQLVWAPRTEVSMTGMPHFLQKTFPAYYFNDQGYQPYKGMACLVPHDLDDSRGNWAGMDASQYSLGPWWHLPRITQDNVCWFEWHSFTYPPKVARPQSKFVAGVYGVVGETYPSSDCMVKVVEHGYCDALVHASYSSNLSGPAVYAILYNGANNDHFPVSTQVLSPADEDTTISMLPLGVVRKVYTESGVTLLPYIFENESSQTNVPYYVARIFFGGLGCV